MASKARVQALLGHGLVGLVAAGVGIAGVYLAGAEPGGGVIALYAALGLAVAALPGLFVQARLGKPLEVLRESILATRNDGDLSRRVELAPSSPVAPAAAAYDELLSSFCSIITRIAFNSATLATMAEKLMKEAECTAQSSREQNAAVETAAEATAEMAAGVREAAAEVGKLFEAAIDRGELTLEQIFDEDYRPIAGTTPQKYHTRYDEQADRLLPAVQEPLLERNAEIVYAIACDRNGYVPTHNRRFSQPLTGDVERDKAGNRTKRIFDDPVGERCGAHETPFLLQTYRRDTGEIMHDISAPVYVKGRHWGGFRIGYRTE